MDTVGNDTAVTGKVGAKAKVGRRTGRSENGEEVVVDTWREQKKKISNLAGSMIPPCH